MTYITNGVRFLMLQIPGVGARVESTQGLGSRSFHLVRTDPAVHYQFDFAFHCTL